MKAVYFALVAAALSGCATLSKDECLTANWYELGQSDGASGQSLDYLAEHRKACAKHGVSVDPSEYAKGRDSGLTQFCQHSVGFNQGRYGVPYKGVCPASTEQAFLEGYQRGREIYQVDQQINKLKSDQELRDYQRRELEEELEDKEKELFASGTSSEKRRQLYAEIDRLKDRIWQLKAPVHKEQSKLQQLQQQKLQLQQQSGY